MTFVKLSKRLKQIAELVEEKSVVYDVGSDHALLPIYLIQNNICEKVYAGDNKEGPLEKAKKNIKKYNLEKNIIPILADGVDKNIKDIDVVVISGMGYYTIKKILDNLNVDDYKYFIVEANSDVNKLRKYLSDHKYNIIEEKIVYDEFYYEIIVFNNVKGRELSAFEVEYGPILLEKKEEIFKNFIDFKINKLIEINTIANNKYYDKIEELKLLRQQMEDKDGKDIS